MQSRTYEDILYPRSRPSRRAAFRPACSAIFAPDSAPQEPISLSASSPSSPPSADPASRPMQMARRSGIGARSKTSETGRRNKTISGRKHPGRIAQGHDPRREADSVTSRRKSATGKQEEEIPADERKKERKEESQGSREAGGQSEREYIPRGSWCARAHGYAKPLVRAIFRDPSLQMQRSLPQRRRKTAWKTRSCKTERDRTDDDDGDRSVESY